MLSLPPRKRYLRFLYIEKRCCNGIKPFALTILEVISLEKMLRLKNYELKFCHFVPYYSFPLIQKPFSRLNCLLYSIIFLCSGNILVWRCKQTCKGIAPKHLISSELYTSSWIVIGQGYVHCLNRRINISYLLFPFEYSGISLKRIPTVQLMWLTVMCVKWLLGCIYKDNESLTVSLYQLRDPPLRFIELSA